LLNLIDHLPQNTHYYQALMNDEGYLKKLAELQEAGKVDKKAPPRWETWSNEREGLARIEDAVRGLGQTIVGAFGGKPGEFKPAQRPATGLDKATANLRAEQHKKLASRFIAGRKRL
jgi:hypothetical protein